MLESQISTIWFRRRYSASPLYSVPHHQQRHRWEITADCAREARAPRRQHGLQQRKLHKMVNWIVFSTWARPACTRTTLWKLIRTLTRYTTKVETGKPKSSEFKLSSNSLKNDHNRYLFFKSFILYLLFLNFTFISNQKWKLHRSKLVTR